MDILISLFSFAVIASLTPGPNNILVMSQSIIHGLRSTLAYQLGAGISCFTIIMATICLGTQLEKIIPAIIPGMKYLGCAYMLYLAWVVFSSKPYLDGQVTTKAGFWMGFFMQFVNPKYYLYTLTLAAVIIPLSQGNWEIVWYSVFFAGLAIVGMFAWALCGALMQQFLRKYYRIINVVMALALVYCSISLFL